MQLLLFPNPGQQRKNIGLLSFHFLQHRACRVRRICPIACCLERSKEEFDALDTRLGPIFCTKLRTKNCDKAWTNFLYEASSQFSAKIHNKACLLSKALTVSWRPRESPSWINAALRTALRAVSRSMRPTKSSEAPAVAAAAAAAAMGSSPSTSDIVICIV